MTKVCFLVFTVLCLHAYPSQGNNMINYENQAHTLSGNTAERIQKLYGLSPMGIGGRINDKVRKLSLSVQSEKELSIEDGRKLVVSCVQEYLNVINNDLTIRPFLENYPFSQNNIELNIFIARPNESKNHFGKLIVISASKGKITYDVLKSEYQHETVLEESFEEAERIVTGGR